MYSKIPKSLENLSAANSLALELKFNINVKNLSTGDLLYIYIYHYI